MKEEDYFRILGVEPRKAEDAEDAAASDEKEQETVEPAEAESSEDGNEEEVVDPPVGDDTKDTDEKAPMSKEKRAKQARLRRQRELDEAVDKARQEERKAAKDRADSLIKGLNLRDVSDGNKPIETLEDYEKWQQRQSDAKLQRDLKDGKLTRQALEKVIEESPSVQAARKEAEARKNAETKEQMEKVVQRELEEIRKLDPTVKDLNDICTRETGAAFRELVEKRHMSFYEAFRLANFESLLKVRQAAATQAAINNQESKRHLASSSSLATGAVDVPGGVMKRYRQLCPWMSEDDIRKDYARRNKKG